MVIDPSYFLNISSYTYDGAKRKKEFFNGENENRPSFEDGRGYVGRISFHPNGRYGLSEGDLERHEEHLVIVSLAASINQDLDGDPFGMSGYYLDRDTYAATLGYKHRGFNFQGEYYWRDNRFMDRSSDDEADTNQDGFYAQAGYAFRGSKWEIAARYSQVDLDRDVGHDLRSETSVGLNRYFMDVGHWLKGCGGTVGFDVFTKPAQNLEALAKAGRADGIQEVLQELVGLASRLVFPDEDDPSVAAQ